MILCHCEVVPGVSNNRRFLIFSLSSGSSSFDCTTTLRYLRNYVSSDIYNRQYFHFSNFFYIFLYAFNVMKYNKCHIPSLTSTGVGRESAVGTDTRYGFGGPGSNAGEDKTFRNRPNRSWGPFSLLYNE